LLRNAGFEDHALVTESQSRRLDGAKQEFREALPSMSWMHEHPFDFGGTVIVADEPTTAGRSAVDEEDKHPTIRRRPSKRALWRVTPRSVVLGQVISHALNERLDHVGVVGHGYDHGFFRMARKDVSILPRLRCPNRSFCAGRFCGGR
jgi:hypothetical protein